MIALSGRTDIEKEVYTEVGFNNKLLKPYKPAELKKNIAKLLKLNYKEQEVAEMIDTARLQSENYDLTDIYEFSGQR